MYDFPVHNKDTYHSQVSMDAVEVLQLPQTDLEAGDGHIFCPHAGGVSLVVLPGNGVDGGDEHVEDLGEDLGRHAVFGS